MTLGIPTETLRDEQHFLRDLGTDSLAMIQIKVELEDIYGLDIHDEDIVHIMTIASTGDYLFNRLSKEAQ